MQKSKETVMMISNYSIRNISRTLKRTREKLNNGTSEMKHQVPNETLV